MSVRVYVCSEALYPNFVCVFFDSVTAVTANISRQPLLSPAPPLLHPSLALSGAHSLPLTLIDAGKK